MRSDYLWLKLSDPDGPCPQLPADAEVRVLAPTGERFDALSSKLAAGGAAVRRVQYLIEDETIAAAGDDPEPTRLLALTRDCHLVRPRSGRITQVTGPAAWGARDAFDVMWRAHAADEPLAFPRMPTDQAVPAGWAGYFPHPILNPAQTEALPQVLGHDHNLVVVAPTGAGKTVIGMAAALRTIRQQGRKSAWLVPQRSLTDELDRDLELWRKQGLRVEQLSGEHAADAERMRTADLWIATTEKFEAICRTSSFRDLLTEVGSLIVDEIHLLGDPTRGPVLEALLARMRHADRPIRMVGLSATVSNAEQLADWLRARLLRIRWRPTRLTWQLPRIPAHPDWNVTEASRTRLAAAITALVTGDGGSVLVFCGSKRNVRQTALVISASRGADVHGIHPDDLERVYQACQHAGVGLHYQGWDHRKEAERRFRQRKLDVLVATSTVAAGVNLPARAVVIRDTQAGLDHMDVATVQQMFGRAGRVGAREREGWAFMIVDDDELSQWQSSLVAGHTVRSRIHASLPDHVLGETVQGRVRSQRQAEQWWIQTLAHHQGSRSLRPLHRAIGFLAEARYLTVTQLQDGDHGLAPTELGRFTARLMVSTTVGYELREALLRAPLPTDPSQAEGLLIDVLATLVPKLAQATVAENTKPAISSLLRAHSHAAMSESDHQPPGRVTSPAVARGDLARAALLMVANSPGDLCSPSRHGASIPYAAMYPVLEEAPRYLHWIGSQGQLGTIHPWCAIVAADLGRRTRWRRCCPTRGAGRLLWMCEQMATAVHAEQMVADLWTAATARGHASPDWREPGRPKLCQLDDAGYLDLLRERATASTIVEHDGQVKATGPAGAVLVTWSGSDYHLTQMRQGRAIAAYPAARHQVGAAVFTWRGDYRTTGWLEASYSRMRQLPQSAPPSPRR